MESVWRGPFESIQYNIRNGGQSVFEHISLICSTATKNMQLASVFQNSLAELVSKWGVFSNVYINRSSEEDKKMMYRTFHMITCMRDVAKVFFRGSVLAALIDNNFHGRLLQEISFKLADDLCATNFKSAMGALMEATFKAQYRPELMIEAQNLLSSFSQDHCSQMLSAFNTTAEFLQQDAALLSGMGVSTDLFKIVDKDDRQKIQGTSDLLKRYKLFSPELFYNFLLKPNPENAIVATEWLSYFRNRFVVSNDQFAWMLTDLNQIKCYNPALINPIFEELAARNKAGQCLIDIRTDYEFISQSILKCCNISTTSSTASTPVNPDDIPTEISKVGVMVHVSAKNYNFLENRKKIQQLKQTSDGVQFKVSVSGSTFKSQEGLSFVTVGDSYEEDLVIANHNCILGTTFALTQTTEGVQIADLQDYSPLTCLLIKPQKGLKIGLNPQSGLNLAGNIYYRVDTLTPNLKITQIRFPQDFEDKVINSGLPQVFEFPMSQDGVTIGRKSGNNIKIPIPTVSGVKHCIIFQDSFIDNSSVGTFLHLQTPKELQVCCQSHFKPLEAGHKVSILKNEFSISV